MFLVYLIVGGFSKAKGFFLLSDSVSIYLLT